MSANFSNKVSAERVVLACVNEFTSGRNQLSGLTTKSITSWANVNELEKGNSIELILRNLSEMAYRMTDRSQESFESMDEVHLKKIEDKIPELEALMCSRFG